MKIYSWMDAVLGVAGIALGGAYFIRGDGINWFFGFVWLVSGGIYLWRAVNQKWNARQAARQAALRRTARACFGLWAWPVRLLGAAAALAGVFLILLGKEPSAWPGLALLVGGVGYTVAIEKYLKRKEK